jgi:HemY protein
MWKFLVWIFVPFLVIAGAAMFLIPMMQSDPGYVLIAIGGKIIEMRFWMAALLLILSIVSVWLLLAIFRGTWRATIKTFNWWPSKAQAQLLHRQKMAIAALWEGDIHEAHRNFIKIAKTKGQEKDTLSLINAANTATDLALYEQADSLLKNAEQLNDKTHSLSVIISRARYHQKQGNHERALALCNRALSEHATNPGLLAMLLKLHKNTRDWLALRALLPRIKKIKLLSDNDLALLEQEIFQGLLAAASNAKTLEETWQGVPKQHRNSTKLEYFYIQRLLNLGCDNTAESILRNLLKKHFDDDLILLFANTKSQDPTLQLHYAERWLDHKNDNPALMLALGRIALRCELWGKAKHYFEKSLALKPSPEAYAELAQLLGHLGDHQNSNHFFQKGLLHSATNNSSPILDPFVSSQAQPHLSAPSSRANQLNPNQTS